VEKVGFDKIRKQQSQLQELKIVIVDGYRINEATRNGSIQEHCGNIVELDLSRNLFESLEEILLICGELPALQRLRLKYVLIQLIHCVSNNIPASGNRLRITEEELMGNLTEFTRVQELEIDDTLLDWASICNFTLQFTSLKTLSASSNGLDGHQLQTFLYTPFLTSLALEFNEFTTLAELSVLAKLPCLKSLLLKGNKIFSYGLPIPVFQPSLEYVDLSYNQISSWCFVDILSAVFPSMTSLRISQNPLYPSQASLGTNLQDVDASFFITIARISGLRTLNFSNISAQDRTNAEMFYLSRIGQELASHPENQEGARIETHRRFAELCALYGHPAVIRKTAEETDPDFLEARLIKFTFYLPESRNPSPGEEVQKRVEQVIEIPKTFDTYRVKGIVGRRFHLQPLSLKLIWETDEFDPVAGYEDAEIDIDDDDMDIPMTGVIKEEEEKMTRKEVELRDSTRPICNTIAGEEATVRIEVT
jgi:hypothetical protein